ncbi:MAG: pyridoxamine 5'-phosphate oxidase family protein [Pseudomonadota bacterium]
MSDAASDKKDLWDIIKDIKFGMLTHRHHDGMLHSHPLTTQNKSLDEGNVLYFFISEKSEMASGLREDGQVNVAYADTDADSYVSVSGKARVSRDPARVEQLWSSVAKAWFPEGPADPDLALLSIDIAHAEFWDVKESKMTQLMKMATAAVTGKPPQLGEHKKVEID